MIRMIASNDDRASAGTLVRDSFIRTAAWAPISEYDKALGPIAWLRNGADFAVGGWRTDSALGGWCDLDSERLGQPLSFEPADFDLSPAFLREPWEVKADADLPPRTVRGMLGEAQEERTLFEMMMGMTPEEFDTLGDEGDRDAP
jgi:hypothetical protein